MMKEAVGQGSAQTLMEEDEEESDFHSLRGEAVGGVCAVAFEHSVGSHLTQVIAQLVKPVALGGQAELDQQGLVQLAVAPAAGVLPAIVRSQRLRLPYDAL